MLKNYKYNKCYIIAEIGGNFKTFQEAKRLIDEASICQVDAIKLQTYQANTVASKNAIFDMENTGIISQYELFREYEIDEMLHKQVFDYVEAKRLDCFSTPSHFNDVDLLEKLKVPAYKIGSDDAVNTPFIRYIAKTQKPIILATGMCTLQEIRESVSTILEEGNKNVMILHAVTAYPTHAEDVNLLAILTLKREFPELTIGYSDHTVGINACICAAALGAQIIEKHFTYDKGAEGPDHMISADPTEMKQIVTAIREFEVMRGSGIKMPAKSEIINKINNRKSLVVCQDIEAGRVITVNDICIKRPGYGIPPSYFNSTLGRIINKNLKEDSVMKWEDLK